MQIDHIHFCVEDATTQGNWFMETMGWQRVHSFKSAHTATEILRLGSIWFVLSAPRHPLSPVADYLKHHPPGVADIALRVPKLSPFLAQSHQCDAFLPPTRCMATIQGWGSLRHTLLERRSLKSAFPSLAQWRGGIHGIDHVVLNVPVGDLEPAVSWYQRCFNLKMRQRFTIKTPHSGLYSQVLSSSNGQVYFNFNEPTSPKSQIQEFLDMNRGAGIQHVALRVQNLLPLIATLRQRQLPFLSVPETYYDALQRRLDQIEQPVLSAQEVAAIAAQQILVDWHPQHPQSLLLQIFSRPIFETSLFFLEFIERRQQAQGFGEGNFQALFEAIERDQIQRLIRYS
ncbi:4-hydroxyphenylpyruvate dioxygenase [Synechococcales cyanobacterium C]|uniref:4-hydroxyphenylpyruvate dioxygenase n=1 Tax=Petrachloros mirabilis ULC683 TaxID=2781853 RepID=A0A8K2A778_9CYAN|nr:4-hydroxyphenylpyruvate dioxygenase [Petrachloros mirabilis]NCJ05800.1 4-hydroxyphenylpyruvate dioxygenase [Petrachloros mirabilis ULC683]